MVIKKIQHKKGFTLIEGLVALAVFSILVVTFYKVFTETMGHMQDSKYRRGAVALANERMEHFRNLAYENVATKANAPIGDIEDDEVASVNGLNYRIITSVFFVDDPTDGSAPSDIRFEDYKRVGVTIIWGPGLSDSVSKADALNDVKYQSKQINLVSQFVPPGGLEAMPTGGILSINVLDTGVEPVESVEGVIVSISDNMCDIVGHPACSESILTGTTDSDGNFMYVGAPICDTCYEITIEKNGYETRETLSAFSGNDLIEPLNEGEYNPVYIHQSVAAGSITTTAFNTNKISQLNIKSQDPFEVGIPDVQFDIIGGAVLGTTADDDIENVYNLNSTGEITDTTTFDIDVYSTSDVLNGNYANSGIYKVDNIVLPGSFSNYTFWKMNPNDEDNPQNTVVTSGVNTQSKMIFINNEYDSAFIRIIEIIDAESVPIEGASVKLQSTTLDPVYEVTLITDEFGYVYFPENTTDTLVDGEDYNIVVNAEEYDEETDSIEISELTEKEIALILSS
ncbi:MAG: prepilin-type N-terminal cleavage/methylation domain-containing protein [Candidatus Moraniibacteriota bacterium]|jgi:prepilin-type N-terminal cleavage/methylation domain-containing protein